MVHCRAKLVLGSIPTYSNPKSNFMELITMVETYKYKSKIATAISFIAAFIVYVGKPGLEQIMPVEYANLIPIIILIAGYIVTQTTENKRVAVAEQLVLEKQDTQQPDVFDNDAPVLNDEYECGDGNDGC